MAIRGRLEHLKLFMVFRSILERRRSGVLTLQSGAVIKRAELVNGYPVRTASNQRSDGFVWALVDEGLISSTEEVELREQAKQTHTPIDIMVLQMGLVAPRRLRSIQRRVARHLLLEPFDWIDGLYQFEDTVVRPAKDAQGIDLVDLLIEAAANTINEEAAIRFVRRYANQHVVPSPAIGRYAEAFGRFFPPPNTCSMLEMSAPFPLIARTRGDEGLAAREVTVMVLSGLARYQVDRPEEVAVRRESHPPVPARPESGFRKVSAPANLARVRTRQVPAGQARPGGGESVPPPRPSAPVSMPPPRPSVPVSVPPPRPSVPVSVPPPRPSAPVGMPPHRPSAAASPSPSRTNGSVPAPPPPPVELAQASAPPRRAPNASDGGARPPDAKMRERIALARERAAQLSEQTHYEVLGISPEAEAKAIRDGFRQLAREFHVDRFSRFDIPEDDMAAVQNYFIAINQAHEVLGDPQARLDYDAELEMRSRGGDVVSEGGGADLTKVFEAERLIRDGILMLRNGNAQRAKDRFDEALAYTPDDPLGRAGQAYSELLVVQATSPSPMMQAKARDVLVEVTAEIKGREEPFLYLGRVYRLMEQEDRAIEALTKALKINAHCAEAASELRHLKHKRKPPKKGLFGRRKKG